METLNKKKFIMSNEFDDFAEIIVDYFNLRFKSREMPLMDAKNYFILWWYENQQNFIKYKTATSMGKLLNMNHATILHHMKHRKPSLKFNLHTKNIEEFVNSYVFI